MKRVHFLIAAAAAALAEVTETATTREAFADFVAEKWVLWRKAANRATRLAEDRSELKAPGKRHLPVTN